MAEKFKQFATDAFTGGTEDQVIKKKSGSNFDFGWGDDGGGGGGGLNIKTAELQLDSGWTQLSDFAVSSGNVCRDPFDEMYDAGDLFAVFFGRWDYCMAVEENDDAVGFYEGESPIVHTILRDTERNETLGITYNEYIICEPLSIEVTYNTDSEDFTDNSPRGMSYMVNDNAILHSDGEPNLNHLLITCPNCTMTEIIPDSDPSNVGYVLNLHDAFGVGGFIFKHSSLEEPVNLEVDIKVPGLFEVTLSSVEFEEV